MEVIWRSFVCNLKRIQHIKWVWENRTFTFKNFCKWVALYFMFHHTLLISILTFFGRRLDHSDGKFLGTMECQWFFTCQPLVSMVFPMVFSLGTMVFNGFLSLDHWYRWFFQWFFHKRRCFFNGFLPSEHWYRWVFQWFFHLRRWFLNGFLPLDHWYRWFFNGFQW